MNRLRALGVSLALVGLFLLLAANGTLTAAVVGADTIVVGNEPLSGAGAFLMLLGVALFAAKRLDDDVRLYISEQARERMERDPFIAQHAALYRDEMRLIRESEAAVGHRPAETVGEFNVSPRSATKNGIRVAWHRGRDTHGNRAIFIDDLRYHTSDRDYDEKWNRKAQNSKITRDDYTGFQPL